MKTGMRVGCLEIYHKGKAYSHDVLLGFRGLQSLKSLPQNETHLSTTTSIAPSLQCSPFGEKVHMNTHGLVNFEAHPLCFGVIFWREESQCQDLRQTSLKSERDWRLGLTLSIFIGEETESLQS